MAMTSARLISPHLTINGFWDPSAFMAAKSSPGSGGPSTSEIRMIPSMPETAPRRSHTARELVTARVTKRTREFPQLFPNPLSTDGLDPRDVALANAIDQAVARRWLTLVAVIRSVVSRPWDRLEAQVQGSLLVGAAQILLLDRIPDHAAINDAVDWIKSRRPKAAGMVNAVLRRVAELNPGLDTGTEEDTPGVISGGRKIA